ncbi:MAG: hypothetical protein QOH89_1366 [Pseudonocardiales bacterium]|nr:hypothetical protein [Pseudonocardiales bacterium]MDT4941178.1 hypothetical protein [Pseudonocardiales bacterium]
MTVSPLIQKSASIAYAGIRMPLAALEHRMPESSRVRTGLHAALQTIDSSVGHLLHRQPEESVAGQSDGPDATTEHVPSQDVEAEREAIVEAVRERQPDVGELADPDLDVAEVQAQLQAKHAIELREEAKQMQDSAARPPAKSNGRRRA